ncbi:hypothetical protein NIES3787_39850 [Microcystis aeruginosa NIES-3787]|uniref:Uncharacterized protein n=1 Tax=Microcystis aeruginosa NIES-3787 TaxID=2517782 RepID=A0A6H9GEA1_MICAE|nr:hypothetical protein NIES3787_39850 [Microcystis aeruginosa NIES-3787]
MARVGIAGVLTAHNSAPLTPLSALKNRVLPTALRLLGLELEAPGRMSPTKTVPAAVPSLLHNSSPFTPSLTVKNRVLPTAVRRLGLELEEPARMSLTKTVPADVPSLFHNSLPFTPSSAVKNRVLPTAVRFSRLELEEPARISLTRTVPVAVPSLFHNSRPLTPLSAVKNRVRVLPTTVLWVEKPTEPRKPGLISLTRTVPAAVPSLFHNSKPFTLSKAVKNRVLPSTVRL